MDEFLAAAIEEAEKGLAEGGIPIGSALVHRGKILGRGHNRRVQKGSAILQVKWMRSKMPGDNQRRSTPSASSIQHSRRARCAQEQSCSTGFRRW